MKIRRKEKGGRAWLLTAGLTLSLILPLVIAGCGDEQGNRAEKDLTMRARATLEALVSGDYGAFLQGIDDDLGPTISEEALRQSWEGLLQTTGPFRKVSGTRTEEKKGYRAVYLTCSFERTILDIKLVFDAEGEVAGFFHLPAQQADQYQAPPYADLSRFSEREVTVESGRWRLPGTLTLPDSQGPFPALVLVHGSGPNNRDEGGGPCAPFKEKRLFGRWGGQARLRACR